MSIKFKFAVPVLSIVLGAVAVPAFAQNNPDNGGAAAQGGGGGGGNNNGGGGGGGGGRGNFNPQQFQQRMLDRLKTQLGATDDEFSAIQPKITAVMTAERDVMTGMFGRGRRGPGGNQAGGQPGATQSDLAKAMADLQTTLDQQDATPDDIKTKLEAVRTARKAAHDTLSKAQDDLKSVLTQRQEAVLVENGLLE